MKIINNNTDLFVNGYPNPFGYALNDVVNYNIKEGKIPFLRLKEWDFYQITNKKFSFYAIIGHVSYATSINCTLFEFDSKKTIYVGKLVPFKKVKLDNNACNDSCVLYNSKDYKMSFIKEGNIRYIKMEANDKTYGKCQIDIQLIETQKDNILVCTPFAKKKHFYLNQKNCLMIAKGYAKFGNNFYEFNENESFGLLDWGRGVLPFKHNWLWGQGSGLVNGKYFGFNIGKFGNNENGTENIFFYDNKSYKMNQVDIIFNKNNYMEKWHYKSDDGNFVFEMTPFYDNFTKTKMLWVDNSCHQIFGKFNGYIIVDGNKIEINDFIGFTENANNRW